MTKMHCDQNYLLPTLRYLVQIEPLSLSTEEYPCRAIFIALWKETKNVLYHKGSLLCYLGLGCMYVLWK
jgi:hypothetical protein